MTVFQEKCGGTTFKSTWNCDFRSSLLPSFFWQEKLELSPRNWAPRHLRVSEEKISREVKLSVQWYCRLIRLTLKCNSSLYYTGYCLSILDKQHIFGIIKACFLRFPRSQKLFYSHDSWHFAVNGPLSLHLNSINNERWAFRKLLSEFERMFIILPLLCGSNWDAWVSECQRKSTYVKESKYVNLCSFR